MLAMWQSACETGISQKVGDFREIAQAELVNIVGVSAGYDYNHVAVRIDINASEAMS